MKKFYPFLSAVAFLCSNAIAQLPAATITSGIISCYDGTTTVVVSSTYATGDVVYVLFSSNHSDQSPSMPIGSTYTFTGVPAGTYTITASYWSEVQETIGSFTISQPMPLQFSVDAGTAPCLTGTTNVVVTVCGGTGSRTFQLFSGLCASVGVRLNNIGVGTYSATSSLQPICGTYTFTGVPPGQYIVSATDANGCSDQICIAVNSSDYNSVYGWAVAGSIGCGGGTTSVVASATAETSSITYLLQEGNCMATKTAVTQQATKVNVVYTAVSPAGQPSGGTYTFTDVPAGPYNVLVRDDNGCTWLLYCLSITASPGMETFIESSVNPLCPETTTGSVCASATGGTPPYSWSRDGGLTFEGTTTQPGNIYCFQNLLAGTYTIVVKDANDCMVTIGTVTLVNPPAVSGTVSVTQTDCTSGTATITVSLLATNGNGEITKLYSIDGINYQADPVFTNVSPGTYNITVMIFECVFNIGTAVVSNCGMAATIGSVNPACTNGTGTIHVSNIIGGAPPYMISKDNGATYIPYVPTNIPTFTNVVPDVYIIRIRDNNNITAAIGTVSILNPAPVGIQSLQFVHVSCSATGSITVKAQGGSGHYIYALALPGGTVTQTSGSFNPVLFGGLAGGTYTLTIMDSNGCPSGGLTTVVYIDGSIPDLLLSTVIDPPTATFPTPGSSITISYRINSKNGIAAPGVIVRVSKPFSSYLLTLAPGQSVQWEDVTPGGSTLFKEFRLRNGFSVPCDGTITLVVVMTRMGNDAPSTGLPVTASIRMQSQQDPNDFDNARANQFRVQ